MSPPHRWFTSLESGEALPAFVVGYEMAGEARAHELAARLPGALVPFVQAHLHQFGGYCCLQTAVVGVTLRLRANLDKARGGLPLKVVHEALAWAPPSDAALEPLHPALGWLRTFVPSAGQELGANERGQLETALSEALPGLPPIDTAWEAFARLQKSGTELFLGWRAFTVRPASDDPSAMLNDWDPSKIRSADDLELSPAHLLALADFGRQEGLGSPRIFLLWDNSD